MSDKKDIFQEAAELSLINSNRSLTGAYISPIEHTEEEIEAATELGTKEWDQLITDLAGTHAGRFNKILKEATDKEFTRLYLKVLEFAFPKKIRDEYKDKEKENNNITITVIKQQNNALVTNQNIELDGQ